MKKVYDIKIIEGEDAGMYRMTSIGEANPEGAIARAEELKDKFEAEYGARCEIVEREVEPAVDFNDLF